MSCCKVAQVAFAFRSEVGATAGEAGSNTGTTTPVVGWHRPEDRAALGAAAWVKYPHWGVCVRGWDCVWGSGVGAGQTQ